MRGSPSPAGPAPFAPGFPRAPVSPAGEQPVSWDDVQSAARQASLGATEGGRPRLEVVPESRDEAPPEEYVGLRHFRCRTKGRGGRIEQIYVSGLTRERAIETLFRQGCAPLDLVEVSADEALGRQRQYRVSRRTLAIFTHQLAILLRSGVAMGRTLQCLAAQTEDPNMGLVAKDLYLQVHNGFRLAQAMQLHPRCFPLAYTALVEIGEMSGELDSVLARLAATLERQVALVGKIRSVLAYPAMVVTLATLLNLGTFHWVLPQFQPVFDSAGIRLPWLTAALMQVVAWTGHPLMGLFLLLLPLGAWLLASRLLRQPAVREAVERRLLQLPLLGPLLRDYLLVEIFTMMGSLTAAGFTVQRTLLLTCRVTSSQVHAAALRQVSRRVSQGELLSAAFHSQEDLFPRLAVHMLAVGEASGRLADMFSTLAAYYQLEVESALDSLPALLEPFLMAVIGVLTGVVVLAVFLPIVQIVTTLL